LVAGLVLCATARSIAGVLWTSWVMLTMPALMTPAVAVAAGSMLGMDGLRADILGAHLVNPYGDRANRDWALRQMRRTTLLTALSAVSAVYAFSSRDWISRVDVPTAVIITRDDRVVLAAWQRKLAAAVHGALVYEIDGDHGVFLNAPGRFTATLLAACQEVCSADMDATDLINPTDGLAS
jgi:pimeloyl-ACP methyl ester carboxylesterase